MTFKYERGTYGEIILDKISPRGRSIVKNLIKDAASTFVPYDPWRWKFGAYFDCGIGHSLNYSVYDYGIDPVTRRYVIVLQTRLYERESKRYPGNLRKTYYLVGRYENKEIFAYKVPAQTINAAIKAKESILARCRRKLFHNVDYSKVIQMDDVFLLPQRRRKALKEKEDSSLDFSFSLATDCRVFGNAIHQSSDSVFVQNPLTMNTYTPSSATNCQGWFKILIGKGFPDYGLFPPVYNEGCLER